MGSPAECCSDGNQWFHRDFERRRQTPTLDLLNRIARGLEVTLKELFGPFDQPYRVRFRKDEELHSDAEDRHGSAAHPHAGSSRGYSSRQHDHPRRGLFDDEGGSAPAVIGTLGDQSRSPSFLHHQGDIGFVE